MTTGIERIATKAREDKKLRFTSLAHHITPPRLWDNLKKIPSTTAVGIDQQDVKSAKENFASWSSEMVSEIHRKGYKPPPTRRVYIPKPGKTQLRPISVPTVIDRGLQKTVADVLNAIYEEDFLDCSFGGRPNRSAHQAIATLHTAISAKKVGWIYEADLKKFLWQFKPGLGRTLFIAECRRPANNDTD
jgi:RNA-directed DNA polymerase